MSASKQLSDPAKKKRFRVALSFPGEHRPRVAKIAEALADTVGRQRVLYDKWYAAEFNRPNLDTYLTKLYHDESDLIVVFLCKEYNAKEWCGLEWRACRDLLKHKEDARLMFFRLNDADIAGLYSIDGYQDISTMTDAEVAAAILQRLGEGAAPKPTRAFTSKLPIVNPTLIGREKELAFLDRAWADPNTNFVQVIAAGGTGKTALVDKWFRSHLGEADFFGWSFYSQGSSADRQTSSDPFFADILAWLHIDIAPSASIYVKAEAVARHLREERMLFVLDGVEPLQESTGALRDLPLKALLQELDTANCGLVVCTTRVRLDIPDDAPRALSIDLDNLSPEQGAEYLRVLKVEGTDEEYKQASMEYWNHALALTLLGTYLVDFCGADIRRRIEIPKLAVDDTQHGAHARRVIAAYERMFAGKPEADVLRALGYFDRPAEPEALKLVMPAMEDRNYRAALKRLYAARLILTTDPTQPIDCHPLIREHFAAGATLEGHVRLYEHYKRKATHRPDTLDEMTPLIYAVYHGCRAGQHQNAVRDVYADRIIRGNEYHLTKKLGAHGINLSLMANFFDSPWTQPVSTLEATYQSLVLNNAGFELSAVGRLTEAVGPMRASAEAAVKSENWINAAIGYGSLSELHLTLGNVQEAIAVARRSLEFAGRSGDWMQQMNKRANLASTLHQSGDVVEAMRLFAEAERFQKECQPELQILYSLRGYRYCDLLLDQGRTAEVLHRASKTLAWVEHRDLLLDIGLDNLLLGRAHPFGSVEAAHHLGQAVDFLRRAGRLEYLPLAMLASGTPRDLDEVFRIATRSGMRLHLTDYHLASARLALANRDSAKARVHFEKAEALIQETGYHRRDAELEQIRAALAG
jgi:tetratricopeptide (TPR) repeat protein